MKKLLTQLFTAATVLTLGASAALAAEGWGDNYEKAQTAAKSDNKLLLLDFTGSDWCPWCIKLNKEVFSQKEFKEYAAKNLVLMEVDFPQTKPQSPSLKSQNARLQEKYQIQGYPTVVVLNGQGKKVGELGYQPGGASAFIAELEKLKK
ncbi:MAG TPA: thioredoxin family protein [Chthoniobacter sp.]|jgi:protein disulfide-isomerase